MNMEVGEGNSVGANCVFLRADNIRPYDVNCQMIRQPFKRFTKEILMAFKASPDSLQSKLLGEVSFCVAK